MRVASFVTSTKNSTMSTDFQPAGAPQRLKRRTKLWMSVECQPAGGPEGLKTDEAVVAPHPRDTPTPCPAHRGCGAATLGPDRRPDVQNLNRRFDALDRRLDDQIHKHVHISSPGPSARRPSPPKLRTEICEHQVLDPRTDAQRSF